MDVKHLSGKALDEAIEANKFILDEYFEIPFGMALNRHTISLLNKVYFRAKFVGFDDFPQRNNPDRPLIFASNHSGMAFPWDGIIMVSGLHRICNYGSDAVRPLTAPMLSQSNLMNPFLIPNLWKRVGSIDATTLNFETAMQQNEFNLLIYPEGVPGIGKGYSRRYQLQRLSTSALRMSLKYKTDIVPVATVNGEFINPYHYSNGVVNKLINKIGIPFLPLGPLTLMLLLQPWLFYYACPAKLTYVRGRRIKPYEMVDKPFKDMSPGDFARLRDQLHGIMQQQLDKAIADYGQKPYRFKELLKTMWKNRKFFPYTVPVGWPLLFEEFNRQCKNRKLEDVNLKLGGFLSSLKLFFKNPFVIFYFIPVLGWIPIFIRGYRGAHLSKKARKQRQKEREQAASRSRS